MSGDAELDRMIASVRALATLPEHAADDIADAIRDELTRTIAAGTTPEGEAWRPTLAGERALKNAAASVHVAAVGRTIYVRLVGVDARHHAGRGRGGVRRQVIPDGGNIPAPMAAVIRRVLGDHFAELVAKGGE